MDDSLAGSGADAVSEEVTAALEAAVPDREVAGVGDAGPSWNDTNRTVRVEFADGATAYLKLAVDGDATGVARERAVLRRVAASRDVRVPGVLAADADREVPYLLTAAMPGRPLHRVWQAADAARRAELAREVGAALAAVHERRFPEHGHVVGGDADGLDLDAAPWTDVLADTVEDVRARATCDRFDGYFDDVLAAVESNRDLLDDAPAALLHGDPAKPNVLWDDDGMGFVDWELAHVGDPARDLVRTREQKLAPLAGEPRAELVEALHEGYRERAGGLPDGFEQRRPVYEAVRFVGVAGFFERHAEFADESREELAAWASGEMERRLAAAT